MSKKDEVQKKAPAKTVSMTFRRPWGRYAPGDRAGFDAAKAKKLEERKIAVPTSSVKDEKKTEDTPAV